MKLLEIIDRKYPRPSVKRLFINIDKINRVKVMDDDSLEISLEKDGEVYITNEPINSFQRRLFYLKEG